MPEQSPTRIGRRLVHAELPMGTSPSLLSLQTIVDERAGATALYLGQQWLEPGDQVFLHTHPVEEVLTFLAGTGEATLGDEIVPICAEISLYIPPHVVHGFRNTGSSTLHVLVVFPTPRFAQTTMVDPTAPGRSDHDGGKDHE